MVNVYDVVPRSNKHLFIIIPANQKQISGYCLVRTSFRVEATFFILIFFSSSFDILLNTVPDPKPRNLRAQRLFYLSLKQLCSNEGNFYPRGQLTIFRRSFDCQNQGGVTSIQQVEAKSAAKYPTVHKTAPTTKSYLVHNVISTQLKLGNPILESAIQTAVSSFSLQRSKVHIPSISICGSGHASCI